MMKTRTRWKTWNRKHPIINKRLFCEELGGFYKITKIQSCKEYCRNAVTPDGSNWFVKERAFVRTESNIKYIVPYLWLYLNSTDESGNLLKR